MSFTFRKPLPLSFAHTQSLPIILLTQSRSKASPSLTCVSSVYEHSTQPRHTVNLEQVLQSVPTSQRLGAPSSTSLPRSCCIPLMMIECICTLPSLPISNRSREAYLNWISALGGSLIMPGGIKGLALAHLFSCWWLDF